MTKNVVLSKEYDRDVLIEKLKENLKEKRFNHCLRVEKKSIELAKKYGADEKKAAFVGLIHDYCKEMPDEKFISIIKEKKMDTELLNYGNEIWHGIVGAEIIKAELGIEDEEILNAIRRHTIAAPYMTTLDKILFVADFIEDGRDFPGVDEARKIANESLDDVVSFELKHTLEFLINKEVKIYPKTLDSYNEWVVKEN